MKKPNYIAGQAIEIEVYNSLKRKSIWVLGKALNVIAATDIPYRIEVEFDGVQFLGHEAAHPDCVRPIKNK